MPYFGGDDHPELLSRNLPVKRISVGGKDVYIATVYDLTLANYGVDRGLGGPNLPTSYDDDVPYTPAWAEKHCGVPRADIITVAREFADNADKTLGKSMVILGAALNHWYHNDMIYRGIMNLLHDVRLHRPVGRRLGALRRPGKAAAADRLGAAGLRPRLASPAAADELHLLLLRPHQPVAPREAGGVGDPLADREQEPGRLPADRLQRACRAHGLAAVRAAAGNQSARNHQGRRRRRHRPGQVCGRADQERRAQVLLRGSGQPEELPAQPVRVALESVRLIRQGPRVFPQVSAGHAERGAGAGPRRTGRGQAEGSGVARQGRRRQAGPAGDARLPHVDHLPVFRHRAAVGHLVREGRPQHLGHASLHPPAVRSGAAAVGIEVRLGNLQDHREEVLRTRRHPSGHAEGPGADAADARHAVRTGAEPGRARLEEGRGRSHPRQDHADA